MMFLAVVGAVVITAALAYATLAFFALLLISDESLWNTITWNLIPVLLWFTPIVVGWFFWWVYIGSKITIGFG